MKENKEIKQVPIHLITLRKSRIFHMNYHVYKAIMALENSQDLDKRLKNMAQRVSSNLLFRSSGMGIEEMINIHIVFRKQN